MGFFSDLGGAIGGIIGAATGVSGAQVANKEAKDSVSRQMDFQVGAYKHRYQWQMEDMKAAGLNPILSYKVGAGPGLSGASYTPQNEFAGVGPNLNAGVTSTASMKQATSASQLRALQGAQTQAQTALTRTQSSVAKSQAWLNSARSHQVMTAANLDQARTAQTKAATQQIQQSTANARQQFLIDQARVAAAISDKELRESKLGQILRRMGTAASDLVPVLRMVK